jgi:peptidylprolyl isomerase
MLIVSLCMALAVAGCGGSDDSSSTQATSEATAAESTGGDANLNAKPEITVPSGPAPKKLEEREIVEGDGAEAKSGDEVTVQYVGVGYDSKEEFDSSWSRNEPFTFPLGAGAVIPGWDQGVAGMKVGGRRELTIPANLAYGPAGSPPAIGPNETLIFVVDLLAVK